MVYQPSRSIVISHRCVNYRILSKFKVDHKNNIEDLICKYLYTEE